MRNSSHNEEGPGMAAKFEIGSPKAGEFNWVLKSQGRTLAIGESYTRKVSAEKAIESLRKAAATAAVADLTLPPAKTPVGKAARVTGRAVARSVVKSGRAVEKAEKTVAKAATKAVKAAKKGVAKAEATTKRTTAKKSTAPRKRTARKS
jgi:uncharacterized protein YegP (UPF0339 family)